MRKLLSANFSRMWKNKVFWFCAVAIFAFVAYLTVMGSVVDRMQNLGRDLDYYYFHPLPFFGLFLSVFISLFLGTEYSDGTIRNKLIIGHTRSEIYFANLLTCFGGCLVFFVVWAMGGLLGIPHFGLWSVGIRGWLQLLLISLLTMFAIVSILTAFSQAISNKAANAIVAIFIALALLLSASFFYNALNEPETTISYMKLNSDGTFELGDEVANPAYVGGTLRIVYQALLNLLPTGQQILISDEPITHLGVMCLCSLLVIVVFAGIGLLLFRKKDIK